MNVKIKGGYFSKPVFDNKKNYKGIRIYTAGDVVSLTDEEYQKLLATGQVDEIVKEKKAKPKKPPQIETVVNEQE